MQNTTKKILLLSIVLLFIVAVFSGCAPLKSFGQTIGRGLGLCSEQPPANFSSKSMLFGKLWPLLIIGVVGATASVFMIMQGTVKWGVSGFVSCIVMLVLSVTLVEHIKVIPWIGSGIIILVIGYAVWQTYLKHQELKLKDVALVEAVETTEAAKNEMDKDQKAVVFGTSNDHGLAGTIQSLTTEKIINKIRGKTTTIEGVNNG